MHTDMETAQVSINQRMNKWRNCGIVVQQNTVQQWKWMHLNSRCQHGWLSQTALRKKATSRRVCIAWCSFKTFEVEKNSILYCIRTHIQTVKMGQKCQIGVVVSSRCMEGVATRGSFIWLIMLCFLEPVVSTWVFIVSLYAVLHCWTCGGQFHSSPSSHGVISHVWSSKVLKE